MLQHAEARTLFHPAWCKQSNEDGWLGIVEAPAYFSYNDWVLTMREWIAHPERNSSTILRGEVWDEQEYNHSSCEATYRCIRRLLPRRTQLDCGMLQECSMYVCGPNHGKVVYTTLRPSDPAHEQPIPNALHYGIELCSDASDVPYYHPAVRGVAFHYIPHDTNDDTQGIVRVDFAPFDGAFILPSSRLGRTALSLLRLLHQHAYGAATSYVKRVHHDMLVSRDAYQDLYVALRTKYAHELIDSWAEVTDPQKHIFEDLGIAAWLILLWREMFSEEDTRGHPPGGFVDVGCGNGLLVTILTCEGYCGFGLDARARKSWKHYVQMGAKLTASVIQPGMREPTWVPRGAFLIGNHADELTPWVPLIAACVPECSGFVNIPCCAWTLEGAKFTPTHQTFADADVLAKWLSVETLPPACMPSAPLYEPSQQWNERLAHMQWFLQRAVNASPHISHSKHLAYASYIARIHIHAGWCLETEALRIPSTKNLAFVARRRICEHCNAPQEIQKKIALQSERLICTYTTE